ASVSALRSRGWHGRVSCVRRRRSRRTAVLRVLIILFRLPRLIISSGEYDFAHTNAIGPICFYARAHGRHSARTSFLRSLRSQSNTETQRHGHEVSVE